MRVMMTAVLVWLMGSFAVLHAEETTYQAGVHYVELPAPAPTQDPNKIEVAELFWYGCGHCFQFEPIINSWKQDLPEDVHFRDVPAMFGGTWNTHAQLFYTVESLGKLDETHAVIFSAIHNDNNRLADEKAMIKLLADYDISEEQFTKAWNSFGVRSKLDQATRLARSYRATGVPTLIVNGKYRIEGSMVGGFDEMLKVADYLVEQERQAAL